MPKTTVQRLTALVYRVTASPRFFTATVILLVLQSIWMAFTAIYPMPFDEYADVGIMSIYARQWSPLVTNQPPEASLFGDITRTGSYLYHYLMSFPYRLLEMISDNQVFMVVSLRLINIVMVVVALYLFRKLFKLWEVSD